MATQGLSLVARGVPRKVPVQVLERGQEDVAEVGDVSQDRADIVPAASRFYLHNDSLQSIVGSCFATWFEMF